MPHSRSPVNQRRRTGVHIQPTYLVTVPVHSQGIREAMSNLAVQFNLGEHERHEPHITLFGPFRLAHGCDPATLLQDYRILKGLPPSFRAELGGPLLLRGRRGFAVVLRAEPCEALARLAAEIRVVLAPHLRTCTWIDRVPGRRIFHISIGFGLHHDRAVSIIDALARLPEGTNGPFGICGLAGTSSRSVRLAVIRRGVMWRAFDFPRGIWLTRGEIFRDEEERKTLQELRRLEGYQLDEPSFEEGEAIFVISDLHLGHADIITHTSRPYPDVETMDTILIRNWNHRVKSSDTVYILGDLRYGRDAKPAHYYLSLLAGSIHFVAGNPDEEMECTRKSQEITHMGYRFLIVHNPLQAPQGYGGYVISGQVHTNQCRELPFMDMQGRRVNVSAERIGYIPLCLDELADLIGAAPVGAKFTTLSEARKALRGSQG